MLARQRQYQDRDSFEKRPASLEPLPTENKPTHPQENAAYFRNKKYVRRDKYDLMNFVGIQETDVVFPMIGECFH